ncbi:MAG: PQQ-dependent sugar dehydrogenase, partial [Chloroflexi bacterium]|nr:PQQ-dependent sugar dehydrogenase [Chloroflexota bacterium]
MRKLLNWRPGQLTARVLVGVLILLLLTSIGIGNVGPPAPAGAQRVPPGGAPPPGSGPKETGMFIRVIDGDTIDTWVDGQRTGIGLLGIDAPQGNTDCGRQAAVLLRQLTQGKWQLVEDPDLSLAFDSRLRRMYHAVTQDGRSVAVEAVRAGVARADGRGNDAPLLAQEEAQARQAGRGCLWAPGPPGPEGAEEPGGPAPNAEPDAPPPAPAPANAAAPDASAAGPGAASGRRAALAAPPTGRRPSPAPGARLADALRAMRLGDLIRPPAAEAAPLAATMPAGFSDQVVASGFIEPTTFAFLPDGRILIAQKNGLVFVYKNGALLQTPFIDIRDRVNDYWDHGLLGLAVDPNFATNGHVYLLYTYENDPLQYDGTKTARLARYTASGDTAAPSSEVVLLGKTVGSSCNNFPAGTDCIPSDAPSHSIGNVKFAADGTLFVTAGDAGHFNAVNDHALRAQDLDSLAGKVLHITTSGAGVSTNPYWNGDAGANRSKVWARGLRNAYRLTLRPSNGRVYLGDVGWNDWEEINVVPAGANLGWPCYEGTLRQAGYEPKSTCQTLYSQGTGAVRFPLVPYSHNGGASAVTGGAFYTGTAFPAEYQGAYFYGDYSQGWIRHLRTDASDALVSGPTDFAPDAGAAVAIEMGPDQKLYFIDIRTAQLRRIVYDPNPTPTPAISPTPTPAGLPLRVNAGGGAFTGGDGRQWAADSGATGGGIATFGAAIAGTTDDPLYQSERYGNFTYSFRVLNGTYTVTLKFAEIYHESPGQRVFNVAIEGQPVLTNFDILAEVSRNTALDKTFTVGVADGQLDIAFTTVADNAKLSALEVIPGSDVPTATPTPTPVPPPGNKPPTATISSPASTLRYKVGDVINYSGSATDPEDGAIPASGLAWQVIIHHCPGGDCHTHVLLSNSGTGGSFTAPDHDDETHLEIVLTATDSGGLTGTASVTIQPQTVRMTLTTSPAGLQVVYNGQSGVSPMTRTTIVGATRTIHAPSPQGNLTFTSWSDGGAQQHNVTLGATDTTYTASFTFNPVRLNAGGGAYTGGDGRQWAADSGATGGSIATTTAAIAGTADDPLYQSERYGNFSYRFAAPNGTYTVTLKFAEIYWDSPGQRVFNVAIEGQPVLTNFDILAQVPRNTALDKTFAVSVADGALDVAFTTVADNAKLSALEVVASTAPPPT